MLVGSTACGGEEEATPVTPAGWTPASSDVEPVYLTPGDKVCREADLGYGGSHVTTNLITYDVVSLDKPDFLVYSTQSMECLLSGYTCWISVTFCVRALDSAPAGVYDVQTVYEVRSGPQLPRQVPLSFQVTVAAP
jgi:hypothetical protein